MAEEFAEFMKKLNSKPIKQQLKELSNVVVNIINLIHDFIDSYTIELGVIHNKIITIETKLINKDNKDQGKIIEPVEPVLNPSRIIGNENTRSAVMGELKGLFKKQNNLIKNKNKS